jgi:hypothetical protein
MDLRFLLDYASAHGYTQLFVLVLANVVLGIAQAIKTKTFNVHSLSDFASKYGWQLVVYGVADLVLKSQPLAALLLATFTASLGAGVLAKVADFVPELKDKLPDSLFPPTKESA